MQLMQMGFWIWRYNIFGERRIYIGLYMLCTQFYVSIYQRLEICTVFSWNSSWKTTTHIYQISLHRKTTYCCPPVRHLTETSSPWPQSWLPQLLCEQAVSVASRPVQWTLSSQIVPVPWMLVVITSPLAYPNIRQTTLLEHCSILIFRQECSFIFIYVKYNMFHLMGWIYTL